MKDLIIIGAGGNSRDILDAILALNEVTPSPQYCVRGFLDDHKDYWEQDIEGYPVLGPLFQAGQYPDCVFVCCIGSAQTHWRRPAIIGSTKIPIERFETIIHPGACVSRFASLGRGTIVLQNATIHSRALVGAHVIIWPNAVISHDAKVGDFACIAASACMASLARVGKACYLDANCTVAHGTKVGDGSLVTAGSAVLEDAPEVTVMAGNPARAMGAVC